MCVRVGGWGNGESKKILKMWEHNIFGALIASFSTFGRPPVLVKKFHPTPTKNDHRLKQN